MTHLWDRLNESSEYLKPVQSQYSIIYDDPATPDAPAAITVPAPEWMAAALAGGILPPIKHYHDMQVKVTFKDLTGKQHVVVLANLYLPDLLRDLTFAGCKIESQEVVESNFTSYEPIGPMTEEEALEYLVMKDVPSRVWNDRQVNRPNFKIVRKESVPTNRAYRDAWRLAA